MRAEISRKTKYWSTALALISLLNISVLQAKSENELKPPITPQGSTQDQIPSEPSEFDDAINPDRILIHKPALQALISISRATNPLLLDATNSRPMSLKEIAQEALDTNLDLGISKLNERTKKANLFATAGQFLPDVHTDYRYIYLKGKPNLPINAAGDLNLDQPLNIPAAGFKYKAYRGGSILFSTLQSRNNYRAARHQRHATMNDTLQEAAKLYYDLLLQEALLEVQVAAVRTSEEQLTWSSDMRAGGMSTNLEVMQAQTQLSQDRQNLIDQQISRRDASISIAEFLNAPQDVDIMPANLLLQKIRLVSVDLNPVQILSIALDNRPEIKQYEELRLAAKKQLMIAAAKLHPSLEFTGDVYGIGRSLGPSYQNVTTPITLPGASSPTLVNKRVNRQVSALWTIGLNMRWNFEGLGTVDTANTYAAKLQARQAMLQKQKVVNQVISQVRKSYLNTLRTEQKIQEAVNRVKSAAEELRLSRLRYQEGLGKNIDVLRAQQDYTSSLIEKARTITDFNIAQVQLLRDMGIMSVSTLTASVPYSGAVK